MLKKQSNIGFHHEVDKILPNEYVELFNAEKSYLQTNILPDSSICDIGSGEGRTIKDLLPITKNITGVDIDRDAINKLKELFPEISFYCADAIKLPFGDDSFDIVTCMMSRLNFGDKKSASLYEMKRIVKDGGHIYISVFNELSIDVRLMVYEKIGLKVKSIKDNKVIFDNDFEGNTSEYFTKEELGDIFDNHGIILEEIIKTDILYICKCHVGK